MARFFTTTSLTVALLALASPAFAQVSFSELRIDEPGEDVDEYVELAGSAGTDLSDLTIVVLGDGSSGGSGVIETVIPLAGQSMPEDGYFLVAKDTLTLGGATPDMVTTSSFENGDNLSFFLVSGFTGNNGDALDADANGELDSTPWASIADQISLVKAPNPPAEGEEWAYATPAIGPGACVDLDGGVQACYAPNHLSLCAGSWLIGVYDPATDTDTPGAANNCTTQTADGGTGTGGDDDSDGGGCTAGGPLRGTGMAWFALAALGLAVCRRRR